MHSATWFLSAVLALTAVGTPASPSQVLASSVGQPFDVSFSLDKETLTLHEPVLVRLRVENRSDHPARVNLGFDRVGNLRFTIAGPGERPVVAEPRIHEGIARTGMVEVAPGETYTQEVLLSALFKFSGVGLYNIQAKITPHFAGPQGGQPFVYESQKMYLRVLPRDPPQLKRVCAKLVEGIMSSGAETSMESAKELSYVNDLVAVPYLEQAATRGPFNSVVRPVAIEGLARISLSSGKSAVFSRLTQKDPRIESEITARISTMARRVDVSSH